MRIISPIPKQQSTDIHSPTRITGNFLLRTFYLLQTNLTHAKTHHIASTNKTHKYTRQLASGRAPSILFFPNHISTSTLSSTHNISILKTTKHTCTLTNSYQHRHQLILRIVSHFQTTCYTRILIKSHQQIKHTCALTNSHQHRHPAVHPHRQQHVLPHHPCLIEQLLCHVVCVRVHNVPVVCRYWRH